MTNTKSLGTWTLPAPERQALQATAAVALDRLCGLLDAGEFETARRFAADLRREGIAGGQDHPAPATDPLLRAAAVNTPDAYERIA